MKYALFNKLATQVSVAFGMEEKYLFQKNKKASIVDARYLLYYLCLENKIQLTNIQKYMENRGYQIPHSTIHYGIKRVNKKVSEDKDYQIVIDRINSLCTI